MTAGGTPAASMPAHGRALRVCAVLFAILWGFFFFGLIDLLVFLQRGPGFYQSTMLETGWGLIFTVLVAAPLVATAVQPSAAAAVTIQQLVLIAVAVAVGAALSLSPPHLIVVLGLVVTAAIIAMNAELPVIQLPRRWYWIPGALVVVAAVPWFVYAGMAASAHRQGRLPQDETWYLDHWPIQAALPIAVLMVAALAATYPHGWVVPTWCVGVCASWFGVVCLLRPDVAASVSAFWAVAAIVWGMAFVIVMHLKASSVGRELTAN